MGAIERPAARGRREGKAAMSGLCEEVRLGRLEAGLSQTALGRLARMSHTKVGRIERDDYPSLQVVDIAVLLALVGRRLWARAYPEGSPSRDRAHGRILKQFRDLLHPDLGWATEVPFPNPSDLRAWDALIRAEGRRAGVEAETRPTDGQALQRKLGQKRRDGGFDAVFLLMPDTRSNRLFLREVGDTLRVDLPMPGVEILEDLRAGRFPRGSGIVLLPRRRGS